MAVVQTPSIALAIQIAWASLVYAGRDVRKKAFKQNEINETLPLQLAFAALILEWSNDNGNPGDYDLKLMRNYVLMLCGQYIVEAQSSIGSGGIVITPTNSTPVGFEGYRDDFIIGQAGSPMLAGDTVLVIPQAGMIRKTVSMFPNGAGIFTIDGSGFTITSVVYTSTQVTITLNQPVQDGEGYTVTGLVWGAAVTPSSGSALPSTDGHEGQYLATDGAGNYYWADTHIDYTSSDFEVDGITVLDTRLDHNTFDLFYNEGNRYLDPETEFTRIDGGGYTIDILGWDANVNSYHLYAELKGLDS